MPKPTPIAVHRPVFLEANKLFLVTTAKSGPGLIAAKRLMTPTAIKGVKYSMILV
jgi:hypothetical protein